MAEDINIIEDSISPLYKDVDRHGGNDNNRRVHARINGTATVEQNLVAAATRGGVGLAPSIIPALAEPANTNGPGQPGKAAGTEDGIKAQRERATGNAAKNLKANGADNSGTVAQGAPDDPMTPAQRGPEGQTSNDGGKTAPAASQTGAAAPLLDKEGNPIPPPPPSFKG